MRLHLALPALLALGCTQKAPTSPVTTDGTDAPPAVAGPGGGAPPSARAEGWDGLCGSCHGAEGHGGTAPAVAGWDRGREALVRIIDERMPVGRTEDCQGDCAAHMADVVLAFASPPSVDHVSCAPQAAPRALRPLSRAEYANTLRDLLASSDVERAACSDQADCDLRTESCVEGQCRLDPCGRHTFIFDSGGAEVGAVSVAGDFNGWQVGAWSLEPIAGSTLWGTKRDVPPGRHGYKFVIDGTDWRSDSGNPHQAPDGFGGHNSVLEIACEGDSGVDVSALVASLPPDTRPSEFPFDNHAGGLITAVHVDEYMKAAERVASTLAPGIAARCPTRGRPCLRAAIEDLGPRVFRRPLTAAELERFGALAEESGPAVALQVMLASPSFLYRAELGVPDGEGGFRLDGYEVAASLSYLLWRSAPDAALLESARAGRLHTPEGRRAEAERLLADPRAAVALGDFASQWLGSEAIETVTRRDGTLDGALRADMLDETRTFFSHVVRSGTGRLDELFVADYSFASAALAAHYGLAREADGRVRYSDGSRAGILGHGSVLATYAHSDQSSPILRGVFVRKRLLCQTFGAPPPDAGGVPDVDPNATTRERFRQHSDDPRCQSCHQYIDELGFGFERFDEVGRYRAEENGRPVDPSGNLTDVEGFNTGTEAPFSSLPELGRIIADSDQVGRCFVTQVVRFASGQDEADECHVAQLSASFDESGRDIRELLLDYVSSELFVRRR